jgi:hypothetical protein
MLHVGALLFGYMAILCLRDYRRRVPQPDMTTRERLLFACDGLGLCLFGLLSVQCISDLCAESPHYASLQYLWRIPQVLIVAYAVVQGVNQSEARMLYRQRCEYRASLRKTKEP